MIRTFIAVPRARGARRASRRSSACFEELVEGMLVVFGAGRCLGVELKGLDRQRPVRETLDRPVVQIAMRNVEAARGVDRPLVDLELVILRGDRDASGA